MTSPLPLTAFVSFRLTAGGLWPCDALDEGGVGWGSRGSVLASPSLLDLDSSTITPQTPLPGSPCCSGSPSGDPPPLASTAPYLISHFGSSGKSQIEEVESILI